ncbi:MAG: hypothetical protein QXN75_01665 [Thermoproteota archaeon]|nr:hypothetical protein [Candidatus Brockarchaeota archaeon]
MSKIEFYTFMWLAPVLIGSLIVAFISVQKNFEKIMELNISGGFWGAYETYEYYSNGTVFSKRKNSSISIPSFVLDELTSRMNLLLKACPDGLELKPEEGAADYFIYNLTVYSKGRAINYYWTDVGEKPPKELTYLYQLLRETSGFPSNLRDIIFYLKTDRLTVNKGETLKIYAVAVNPIKKDFYYSSPTPCSPDFKIYLQTPSGRRIELFPIGYDPGKVCVQVIQERVLKAGEAIRSEYEYKVDEEGIYVIEAHFPYAEWEETRHHCVLEIPVS